MEASELLQRLTVRVTTGGAVPVSRLVVDDMWLAVIEGALEVGERLPTARELAIGLGVSPRSIERAYAELERRGVIVNRAGAGTFVSLSPASDDDLARHQDFDALCADIVERAAALDFDIDDVIDALTELRTAERDTSTGEPGP